MKTTEVLFSFNGRITRRQYWMQGMLPMLTAGALFLLYFLAFLILSPVIEPIAPVPAILFFVMFIGLAILNTVAGLAINTKRLHDLGRSGWWNLLLFIPLLGYITSLAFIIILGGKQGQLEENRYGPIAGPHKQEEQYASTMTEE